MQPHFLPITVAAGLLLAATTNLRALPPRQHSVSGVVEAIDCGSHTITLKSGGNHCLSLRTGKGNPMNQFDASKGDCEYVQCAVCEKVITGGKWFARIKHGDWMVALCCPLCTEAFESKPHAYVRRIESLAYMRSVRRPEQDSPLNE